MHVPQHWSPARGGGGEEKTQFLVILRWQVVCHPPVSMTEAVSSGTYCLHTCHGHPKVNCKAINNKGFQSGPSGIRIETRMTSRGDQSKRRPPGSESRVLTAKHREFCSWSQLETATRTNVRSFVSAYFTTQWKQNHPVCKKTMHHSKQFYSPPVPPQLHCVKSHNPLNQTASRGVLLYKNCTA